MFCQQSLAPCFTHIIIQKRPAHDGPVAYIWSISCVSVMLLRLQRVHSGLDVERDAVLEGGLVEKHVAVVHGPGLAVLVGHVGSESEEAGQGRFIITTSVQDRSKDSGAIRRL